MSDKKRKLSSEEASEDSNSDEERMNEPTDNLNQGVKRKNDLDPELSAKKLKSSSIGEEESSLLFIGNVADSATDESITEFLKQAGTVKNIRWKYDANTGAFKHFGFIEMSSPEEAKKAAFSIKDKTHCGNLLTVQISQSRKMEVGKCAVCGSTEHNRKECTLRARGKVTPVACFLCGEMGHKQKDCSSKKVEKCEVETIDQSAKSDSKQASETTVKICYLCGSNNHSQSSCNRNKPKEKMTCRICGSKEHLDKKCTAKKCFSCGKLGHVSIQCPKGSSLRCFGCKEEGHMHKDCPKHPKRTHMNIEKCHDGLSEEK